MFSSLPLIEPRESHSLWYIPAHPNRFRNHNNSHNQGSHARRPHQQQQQHGAQRSNNASIAATTAAVSSSADSLATLLLEEHALQVRKQNIAAFGYAWIKPAGCSKTMLGVREEEAEREEGAAAAAAEAEAGMDFGADGADLVGGGGEEEGEDGETFERNLDDDIPDADADGEGEDEAEEGDVEGLVEEGEEGLEEGDVLMERDLDDEVPDGFGIDDEEHGDDEDEDEDEDEDDEDEDGDYFDNQPDLDDDIPSAPLSASGLRDEEDSMMERDLDADIPSLAEDGIAQQQQWEHTDTDEDDEDDEEEDEEDAYATADMEVDTHASPAYRFHSSSSAMPASSIPDLHPNSSFVRRETEAESQFLRRWGGGGGDNSPIGFESPGNLRNQRRRPRRRSAMTASSDSLDL
ncbi:conserved hypothetical protein [Histoplasma capsulatum var. duboisii H88]|uniref:Replicase polyprotein 1a n=2 Tax=Ajellomyces capsulatus (strain H88) TaxID=544711 RepID=F0UMD6_AJEC8|nr:conserved hypothetical protein [Histoplasma capsulatum var. duboisii H88]